MKILVMTGSPHKHGTTALRVDRFIQGATEAGNDVFRFDTAFRNIHFCTGCEYCQRNQAPCVQKDDMPELIEHLIKSDVVVYVTPLYSFGFSSQIKVAIERFYPVMEQIKGNKKTALLASSYDNNDWTMGALLCHFETLSKYLKWEIAGTVLACGCGTRNDIENTDFPEAAYQLGLSMKQAESAHGEGEDS